ncbi:MAG: glycosyltransferase [Candidatus Omnitrophica bacterium]|nr:glycosyltransferase [Candidatus Omnitrophota bacterium]
MKIFIGWDSREDIAYQVCAASLRRHSSAPLEIIPLKQDGLRQEGLYWRPKDPLASTEFTYTRFLTPYLAGYKGWAMFVDCDFLFTADVAGLFSLADERYAVLCVKHDYRPKETSKMDGVVQTVYPRKNWSSLALWNCAHEANQILTPQVVNSESGAFLHRFSWLTDDLIGSVPETWNWLEGWSGLPKEEYPKGIHFTRGGPWFENWKKVQYADLWLAQQETLQKNKITTP